MRKISHKSKLWEYLDSSGVLVSGTEEQIKAVKEKYRKEYLLEFKRKQREKGREITIKFEKDGAELKTIEASAKKHALPVPEFIRTASLAYCRQTFITPNKLQIAQLQQVLSGCLDEIKIITSRKDSYLFQQEQKITDIEKRIIKLETDIEQILNQVMPIEEYIRDAIKKEPSIREKLLTLLTA